MPADRRGDQLCLSRPRGYPNGIIGDFPNLPAFRGGIALGPDAPSKNFAFRSIINNDGGLFAYGEAIAGFLPYINGLLEKAGSPKRYKNLFGITLGTGFGGGFACNGELFAGDNSNGFANLADAQQIEPQTMRRKARASAPFGAPTP